MSLWVILQKWYKMCVFVNLHQQPNVKSNDAISWPVAAVFIISIETFI